MRSRALAALLLLPLLAGAAPVLDEETKARSKAHFELARNHKALGQYDPAIAEYHEAHKLFPAPDFLYNIAVVYRLKGDRASAIAFYRRYLDEAPEGRGAADARSAIDTLSRELEAPAAPKARPPEPTHVLQPMDPLVLDDPAGASARHTTVGDAPSPEREVAVEVPATPTEKPREAPRSRAWVWGLAIGGVVVVGLAVGLGVGLGVKRDAPVRDSTFGSMEFPFP